MTREELKAHCERQIQEFERVEKIMPVTPNAWKRYEEHNLILELLEQEPKTGHWISDGYKTEEDWIYGRITYKCPFCGHCDNYTHRSKYCPDCGARMVEPQEREEKE